MAAETLYGYREDWDQLDPIFYGVNSLFNEVRVATEFSNKVTPSFRKPIRTQEMLEDTLNVLDENLQRELPSGKLLIYLNDSYADYMRRTNRQFFEEYTEQIENETYRLVIPGDKITSLKSLPQPNGPEKVSECHPAIDIRIVSPFDTSGRVYAAPGQVVEPESVGRWYHFSLVDNFFVFEPNTVS